jgi:glycosyltransferase involved in cell wall biosynthesis
LNLVWYGVPYDPTGYGEEARGFIGALDRGGARLKIVSRSFYRGVDFLAPEQRGRLAELERAVVDPDRAAVVQHIPANMFSEHLRGRVNIGRTMLETDLIPRDWAERCNRMDEIWVPSRFNVETFSSSGVARDKLRVVPGGVDAAAFHPAAPPARPGERGFVFLSVFGWFNHKGWDILLKAYCDEFKQHEDVMLLIKTYNHYSNAPALIEQQVGHVMRRFGLTYGAAPSFRIITRNMASSLMPGLYTSCDAFVLPSRGEAWGRPYLEAMSCGLPVIGTRWSGNLDFMNDANSYLLEIEGLEDVYAHVDIKEYAGHRWARPSMDHLRHLMRHVYEHRQEAREKGAAARADVCDRWTWEHAASAVARELEKYDDE